MSRPPLPGWEELAVGAPTMTATMRGYLDQIACVLRPSSVTATDVGLRTFAAFLAQTSGATEAAPVHARYRDGTPVYEGQQPPRLGTQKSPWTWCTTSSSTSVSRGT